MIGRFISALWQ